MSWFLIGVLITNCLWVGAALFVIAGRAPMMLIDRWWLENDERWHDLREIELEGKR